MANENNQANFDEIEAHCKLASAKLLQMIQKQPSATNALEDLEDYYDRQLQLRVIQNNTLLEELRDSKAAHTALRHDLHRCALALAGLAVAYLVAVDPWRAYAAALDYWSYCVVACIAYLVARATL